jgi:hypothetical protein
LSKLTDKVTLLAPEGISLAGKKKSMLDPVDWTKDIHRKLTRTQCRPFILLGTDFFIHDQNFDQANRLD